MKILDIYIIKKYLGIFVFLILIFSLIAMAVDVGEKIDKFVGSGLGFFELLKQYFFGFFLFINFAIWPLYTLITSIFLSSRLGENNEIISMLNGGISFGRIMRPFLIAAGVMTIFHLACNHYFVPFGDKLRVEFEANYINRNKKETSNYRKHLMLSPNSKIYFNSFNLKDSTGRQVRIEEFQDNEITKIWDIKKMTYLGTGYEWQLEDYTIRKINGKKEELIHVRNETLDTTLYVHPKDFSRIEDEERGMITPELIDKIKIERLKGTGIVDNLLAELHRRTAEPFMNLILTLMAVSIASRKTRGGLGMHLAKGIGIGSAFVFLSRFAKIIALSSDGLSVGLGIWLPNMLFFVIALYFYTKSQK